MMRLRGEIATISEHQSIATYTTSHYNLKNHIQIMSPAKDRPPNHSVSLVKDYERDPDNPITNPPPAAPVERSWEHKILSDFDVMSKDNKNLERSSKQNVRRGSSFVDHRGSSQPVEKSTFIDRKEDRSQPSFPTSPKSS